MTVWDAETVGIVVAGCYTLALVGWALVAAVLTLLRSSRRTMASPPPGR